MYYCISSPNLCSSYWATSLYLVSIISSSRSCSSLLLSLRSKSSLIFLFVLIRNIPLIYSIRGVSLNLSLLLLMLCYWTNGEANVKFLKFFTTVSSYSFDIGSSTMGVSSDCFFSSSSYSTPLLIILLRIIGDEWRLYGIRWSLSGALSSLSD